MKIKTQVKRTYLIFDVNSLAYRAYYGMASAGLSSNGHATGVYFNVLGTILQLQGRFNTNHCIFAFDSRKNKRKEIYPQYKQSRKRTPEENETLWELFQQIKGLKEKYLPLIGFRNLFLQPGQEADDVIASICQNLSTSEKAIVVSTDTDLLQLLNNCVQVYNPTKQLLWTTKIFKEVYGISPLQWATVKAIAGCTSDGVKGIEGVGEKTAIKFLNQTLSLTSKAYQKILSQKGMKIRKRNLGLVKLPFKGTKIFKLKRDGPLDWTPTLKELEIKKLLPSELEYREAPK